MEEEPPSLLHINISTRDRRRRDYRWYLSCSSKYVEVDFVAQDVFVPLLLTFLVEADLDGQIVPCWDHTEYVQTT
jgi:hypothetical protein